MVASQLDQLRLHGANSTSAHNAGTVDGYQSVGGHVPKGDVLRELDTVTDMADYLTAKEDRPAKGAVIIEGGESELLGYYLLQNRTFPSDENVLFIDGAKRV